MRKGLEEFIRDTALAFPQFDADRINACVMLQFGQGADHNLLGRVIASVRIPKRTETRDLFEDEPTLSTYDAIEYLESVGVRLGTSPHQALNRCWHRGEVAARREGRKLRFLKSSLDAFAAKRKRRAS